MTWQPCFIAGRLCAPLHAQQLSVFSYANILGSVLIPATSGVTAVALSFDFMGREYVMHEMSSKQSHYPALAVMTVLSFIAMYVLMYAMVDRWLNVYASINQIYMAALMTAPMVIFELLLMRHMYKNSRANAMILVASILVGLFAWLGIRQQMVVGDVQFLRSMIPHHAGAILMCQEAGVTDPEIKQLCRVIVDGQQREIDQMQSLLARKQSN
ncbi:MAG: DUF305 domain-containing protein [Steroidobacteraceae bacterium]